MQSDPPQKKLKLNLKEKPETKQTKQKEEKSCGDCGVACSDIVYLPFSPLVFSCKLSESTFLCVGEGSSSVLEPVLALTL